MDKKALLRSFLAEDAAENDITSRTLLENTYVTARIEAREEMILSGIEECGAVRACRRCGTAEEKGRRESRSL